MSYEAIASGKRDRSNWTVPSTLSSYRAVRVIVTPAVLNSRASQPSPSRSAQPHRPPFPSCRIYDNRESCRISPDPATNRSLSIPVLSHNARYRWHSLCPENGRRRWILQRREQRLSPLPGGTHAVLGSLSSSKRLCELIATGEGISTLGNAWFFCKTTRINWKSKSTTSFYAFVVLVLEVQDRLIMHGCLAHVSGQISCWKRSWNSSRRLSNIDYN